MTAKGPDRAFAAPGVNGRSISLRNDQGNAALA
ncbi:hypothetical protein PhaeoP97_00446 [Phaeobacter porticola]|uniref:Uncharacterized protein n=1 Tax=Phaeobacter porticola TaxID=1844006 RepID=A0A1L3I191_9RHOB|nr:hypothetical protein PhaeoP97_00446 [Phaeobacter porticola]